MAKELFDRTTNCCIKCGKGFDRFTYGFSQYICCHTCEKYKVSDMSPNFKADWDRLSPAEQLEIKSFVINYQAA